MTAATPFPAAVLWDMDGTLIDTEPYWMAEEGELVAQAGGTWTHEDAVDLVGNSLLHSAQIILERTPVTGTPEEIVQRLLDGVVRRTRAHLPWRPGARELLQECVSRGIPCALVTMSWTPLAEVLLEALPPGTFTAVVTGDLVTHGKPHPEPYLRAAELLGVAPRDCIALEDSGTGVRSATAAGVPTVAVPHVVPVPATPGMVTVDSLEGMTCAGLSEVAAQVRA